MRILVWLALAGMAGACASREAPRPLPPPAPSAWALDKQPIPGTLDEALDALQRGLGEPTIARLRIAEEDIAITLVPTLGRWMQEHWGLATGGPLAQYFEARGLAHPDDMAACSGAARAGVPSHRVHSEKRRERRREAIQNIRTGGCVETVWHPEPV
jgi:hypothetical protein